MISNPETSVVITCYNYGRYIEGCLRSVLEQTYEDYEIVVIDDGSTDETPKIMQRFVGFSNLRYIRQENRGQANAKNNGIKHSRGRYVAFLDADDQWEKSKLEKQLRLFERSDVGVVYSESRPMDKDGNLSKWDPPTLYLVARSGKVSNWLFFDNFVPFSSSVVRKECLMEMGTFNENLPMGIDWDLWLRISTRYEFDFVPEELLFYRIGHPDQMSKNALKRQECSDIIMSSFLRDFPGAVSKKTIDKAYSYTFCNRGDFYSDTDKNKSRRFFIKAVLRDPANIRGYYGLLRALIP